MDGRDGLAQSRKPKIGRRAAAARWLQSRAASEPRWHGHLLRWGAAALRYRVPRGVGASAAALLLLGAASYGAVRGNHIAVIAANLRDICNSAASAVGFGISDVALVGEHNLSRKAILTAAGINGHTSLLFLDAHATRERLMKNPWVADATVLKLYPGSLRIEITERKPFALWQEQGHLALIAADGTELEPFAPRRFFSLPLVVGGGAQHEAKALLTLVKQYPDIAHRVAAYSLVAERRWTLYLKSGLEVLLPEENPAHALKLLVDLDHTKQLLSRDIVKVDLRLPDRVFVQLSDAAAAAREADIKAAEKARKKKAKGGEA